jgi:hypothetical protein
MGAWGYSLYSDDTTCDVRDSYIDHLRRGHSDSEAGRRVLRSYRGLLRDLEVKCLVHFALADAQWKYGRLELKFKRQALALIERGGDVPLWRRDAGEKAAAARMKHLLALKRRLLSKMPHRRAVRVVPPRLKRMSTQGQVGSVYLVRLPDGKFGALVLVGHIEVDGTNEPVFSGLDWCGERLPSLARLKKRALKKRVPFASGLGPCTEVAVLETDGRKNPTAALIPTSTVITSRFRCNPNDAVFKTLGGIAADLVDWFGRRSGRDLLV